MDSHARTSRFESLYSAHSGDVYGYALRRGADEPDAEDVVVDTFLICWRRLNEVPNPPLPWLLGVARRVLANQRRGERRRLALRERIKASLLRRTVAASASPADSYALKDALASLRDTDREVLALVAWQGLTHEAAADVMGCTRNAFTKRYLRAYRNLQARLPTDWTLLEQRDGGSPAPDRWG